MRTELRRAAPHRRFAVVLSVAVTDAPASVARGVYELAAAPGFLPRQIVCVAHPTEAATHAAEVAELAAAAHAGAQRYLVSVGTFAKYSRAFVYHTLRNAAFYADSLDFGAMHNRFRNATAVVVGAGPSLDESLPALKLAASRALVIACDTATPALIAEGIVPHVIAAIDLQPRKSRILRSVAKQIAALHGAPSSGQSSGSWPVLAVMQYANPRLVAAWPGPRMWLGAPSAAARVLAPTIASVPETLSVAHAAFFVARHFGCSPIVLVGLDLAFTDGERTHSAGTFGHWGELGGVRHELFVPGLDGREWPTLASMHAMATSFAAAIAETEVPVWNATLRGQLIPGAHRHDLHDGLDFADLSSAEKLDERPFATAPRLAFDPAAVKARLRQTAHSPPDDLIDMAAFGYVFRHRDLPRRVRKAARRFVATCCRLSIRHLSPNARLRRR